MEQSTCGTLALASCSSTTPGTMAPSLQWPSIRPGTSCSQRVTTPVCGCCFPKHPSKSSMEQGGAGEWEEGTWVGATEAPGCLIPSLCSCVRFAPVSPSGVGPAGRTFTLHSSGTPGSAPAISYPISFAEMKPFHNPHSFPGRGSWRGVLSLPVSRILCIGGG